MQWFRNLRLSKKILTGILSLCVLSVGLGVFSIYRMTQLNGSVAFMKENWVPALNACIELQRALNMYRVKEYQHILSKTPEAIQLSEKQAQEIQMEIKGAMETIIRLIANEEERRLVKQLEDVLVVYMEENKKVFELSRKMQKDEAATLMLGRSLEAVGQLRTVASEERKLNERGLEQTSKESDDLFASSRVWIISLLTAGTLASIAFGVYLARLIANPVNELSAAADRIAQGDLDAVVTINTREELGQLAESFRKIIAAQKDLTACAVKISVGDLNVDLKLRSEVDELTKSFLSMKGALQGLLAETDGVVQAAREGKLDHRGDAAQYQGAYRSLIEGFNSTLDAVIEPVNEAGAVLERVADRDLTARVAGEYRGDNAKIKIALNNALEQLEDALTQAAQGSDQVSSAANEISKGSQSLAQGASEQAGSLEEISSSLEEMASMTKQNADNSQQGKLLASSARESSERGIDAMKRMAEAMDRIKSSSDATAKIVKTINEIAFQTNLLALNAAVEAARAGEAGKGFAVVAEEVRNLAQRSAEAARNTADMIDESLKNADNGVKISSDVATILNEIGEGNRKVNDLVAEIAAASDEQSKGIEQVNSAVTQLDKVTQQNAANSEESASAAEELSSQAVSLSQVVGQFKLSKTAGAKGVGEVPAKPRTVKSAEATTGRKSRESKPSREPELVGAGVNGCGKPQRLIPLDDEDFKGF